MLKDILIIIGSLANTNMVKTKRGRGVLLIISCCSIFMYMVINNSISLRSILDKYSQTECKTVHIKESKALALFASKCNNGKSDKCYVTRWCIDNFHNDDDQFRASLYQLVTCYLGHEGEDCNAVILSAKYERPLYIDASLLYRSSFIQGDSTCGYITKENMITGRYGELLDYSNMLSISSNLFTYCIDHARMTLLMQQKGHDSTKGDVNSFLGCVDKYCLVDVMSLHSKLKKITR
jgi:hypothetical protein